MPAELGRRKKARGRAQVYFFPGPDHSDHNFKVLSEIYCAVLQDKSVAFGSGLVINPLLFKFEE